MMKISRFGEIRQDLRDAESRLVEAAKRVSVLEVRVEIAERRVARRRRLREEGR